MVGHILCDIDKCTWLNPEEWISVQNWTKIVSIDANYIFDLHAHHNQTLLIQLSFFLLITKTVVLFNLDNKLILFNLVFADLWKYIVSAGLFSLFNRYLLKQECITDFLMSHKETLIQIKK